MHMKEVVIREIACEYLEGGRNFTQLMLSRQLNLSLSLVNSAVRALSEISSVRVAQRGFEVISLNRLLLYWATHRQLSRDIVFTTRVALPVRDLERSMPDEIAFTGYTAYRFLYDEAPADYSEVYVYATVEGTSEIRRRFEPNGKVPNLTVMKADPNMEDAIRNHRLNKSSVCPAQLFVDLWNMKEWYARDYTDSLSRRLGI
ncbi:MAG: hypothetical protein JRN37_05925 [Nitrososphaerota archaeon]|nr:hypothetical protein [Nitrososphaerota archaeon]MDG7041347.1 hypothetical protein [Nitrososphaerota archaeon]MDG7043704.1 hypothetical protein [Nitrososphaerota archaeon]